MSSFNGDDFKGLRITQLDDDDEEQAPVEPINVDEFDDEDDDEDDEEEPVILGFVESPKFPWSSLRQLFPNLAGGVPVLIFHYSQTQSKLVFLCS